LISVFGASVKPWLVATQHFSVAQLNLHLVKNSFKCCQQTMVLPIVVSNSNRLLGNHVLHAELGRNSKFRCWG